MVNNMVKNMNFVPASESLSFWEWFSQIMKDSLMPLFLKSLQLLFFKQQWEQFAHGHSFLKSSKSESLTVVL